jgi:hypothetical protein
MKLLKKKPRIYKTGVNFDILIKDCGSVFLENNEQITFLTKDKKKEYDVCRTKWGYYATPSINGRLKKFNFKTALTKNSQGKFYILIVEKDKVHLFKKYLEKDNIKLVSWLDEDLGNKFEKLKKTRTTKIVN